MFQPNLHFTATLIKNLTEVERLYGQLETMRLPKQARLNLEKQNLIQSAYVSNSIEGNPLSLAEVTNLLLGEQVPTNRDEKEVANYYEILKQLPNYQDSDLNLSFVMDLHKQLLTGVDDTIAGQIRDSKVVIGKYVIEDQKAKLKIKHEPPSHQKRQISQLLIDLLAWTKSQDDPNAIIKAGIFHHQFVFIHPFADGNGRTCRLLTALMLIKHNYQVNKYFVLDDYYDLDRQAYSDKLHSADKGNKTEWLEYFTLGMKYSLQSALAKARNTLAQIDIKLQPTKQEQKVLAMALERPQITSTEVATQLNITRQQAHKLLNGLVQKGFLQKQGGTKGSYYQVI